MWGEGGWVCVGGDWEFEVGGGTDCCMGDKKPRGTLIKEQLNLVLKNLALANVCTRAHTHTHTHTHTHCLLQALYYAMNARTRPKH